MQEPEFEPRQVGEWIKAARAAEDVTQEWLGEAAGVTKQAISQFEDGTTLPGEETFRKIVTALRRPSALADRYGVFRETERWREAMVRRGIASEADIDATIRLARSIQDPRRQ